MSMAKLMSGRVWLAVVLGIWLALLPGVASAQQVSTPDRDRVMIWTAVAAVLALIACAIGYAWRRMEGMDHPTPDELEMMGDDHAHGGGEHGADLAVHPHAEAEHAAAGRH
jgi:hypothetical protein